MDKEKIELQLKFTPNYKKYSILLNCYRVGGMKWNDIDGAIFHKIDLSKEDVLFALGVKQQIADLETKLAESEKEVASLQCLLFENANDRKAMQEFKIGEYEYDPTDEDARNSLCWEVEELKQQLAEKEKERHEEWLNAKEWKWECDRLKKQLHTANQETLHFQNKYFAENQKAIAELEKVQKYIVEDAKPTIGYPYLKNSVMILNFVCDQIKSLKGEK